MDNVKLIPCKKPKLIGRKGTWNVEFKIINGSNVVIHYETTWGKYGYFELSGQWYKVSVFEFDNFSNNPTGINEYYGTALTS